NLITEVEQLLASDNVTQEQIDTVMMNLQEEIKQIKEPEVTVDKTGLEQALENAKKADTENKTEESVVNLEKAIEQAETVFADGDATVETVTKTTNAIYDAITNLDDKKEEKKDSLQEMYEQEKKLDVTNKTNTSKENLVSAIAHAESVLHDGDASHDEVDSALETLQQAIDSVEEIEVVKKETLQEKVDEAKKIDTTNKTESSKAIYDEALAEAEALLKNN